MDDEKVKKISDKWDLHEMIDPRLSEEEIKKIINKKLAQIIIELEHNPISFIKKEKFSD